MFHTVFYAIRHVFQTKILADAICVDHSSDVELLSGEIGVGLLDIERYDIDAVPLLDHTLLPCHNLLGKLEVVSLESCRTLLLGIVEPIDIIVDHAGHGEVGRDMSDRTLDILDPLGRVTL